MNPFDAYGSGFKLVKQYAADSDKITPLGNGQFTKEVAFVDMPEDIFAIFIENGVAVDTLFRVTPVDAEGTQTDFSSKNIIAYIVGG